jgi:hypothetical protein
MCLQSLSLWAEATYYRTRGTAASDDGPAMPPRESPAHPEIVDPATDERGRVDDLVQTARR